MLAGLLLLLFLFDLSDHVAALFVMLPMLSLGILYWYGRPQPRRTAYLLATGLQLTLVVCGVEPVVRVVTRVDDGNLQARLWKATESGWFGRRTVLAGRAKD